MNDSQLINKAQRGDSAAMAQLIEDNSALIYSIARRFANRGTDAEDLYQIGVVGFIKCIQRFNTDYDVRLSTYAVPLILGELRCYFRDNSLIKISRRVRNNYAKILSVLNNHSDITLKEAAGLAGVDYGEAVVAVNAAKSVKSLDSAIDEDGRTTLADTVAAENDEEEKTVDRIALYKMFDELDERDKKIIRLRYFENKTQCETADIIGVSQVQISRLEKRILAEMRKKLVF